MVSEFTEHQVDLGLLLYDTALGGTPMQGHQLRWLRDVRIGDVVIEMTSNRHRWQDRIGSLLRVYTDPVLDEDGKQYTTERKWVLQTNEREFTWHDADFIRIPTTEHQRGLYKGYGERCTVFGDCKECARERWTGSEHSWRQELRR